MPDMDKKERKQIHKRVGQLREMDIRVYSNPTSPKHALAQMHLFMAFGLYLDLSKEYPLHKGEGVDHAFINAKG